MVLFLRAGLFSKKCCLRVIGRCAREYCYTWLVCWLLRFDAEISLHKVSIKRSAAVNCDVPRQTLIIPYHSSRRADCCDFLHAETDPYAKRHFMRSIDTVGVQAQCDAAKRAIPTSRRRHSDDARPVQPGQPLYVDEFALAAGHVYSKMCALWCTRQEN